MTDLDEFSRIGSSFLIRSHYKVALPSAFIIGCRTGACRSLPDSCGRSTLFGIPDQWVMMRKGGVMAIGRAILARHKMMCQGSAMRLRCAEFAQIYALATAVDFMRLRVDAGLLNVLWGR